MSIGFGSINLLPDRKAIRWMALCLPILAVVVVAVYARGYWATHGGGESVESLTQKARSGDVDQRQAAIVRLGRSGEKGAAQVHDLLASHPDAPIRTTCVRVLGDIYHFDSMDLLLNALADENPAVRAEADAAVTRIMGVTINVASDPADPAAARRKRIEMLRSGWGNMQNSPLFDSYKKRINQQIGAK